MVSLDALEAMPALGVEVYYESCKLLVRADRVKTIVSRILQGNYLFLAAPAPGANGNCSSLWSFWGNAWNLWGKGPLLHS